MRTLENHLITKREILMRTLCYLWVVVGKCSGRNQAWSFEGYSQKKAPVGSLTNMHGFYNACLPSQRKRWELRVTKRSEIINRTLVRYVPDHQRNPFRMSDLTRNGVHDTWDVTCLCRKCFEWLPSMCKQLGDDATLVQTTFVQMIRLSTPLNK